MVIILIGSKETDNFVQMKNLKEISRIISMNYFKWWFER